MTNFKLGQGVLFGLIALVGSIVSTQTQAEVFLKETIRHYKIDGKTGAQLMKSIRERGPKVGAGRHAIATTEYSYDVRIGSFKVVLGRCVPQDVDVLLGVRYTYPKWKNKRGASRNMKKVWADFMDVVEDHEKGHVKIAIDYAEDLARALKRNYTPASRECEGSTLSTRVRVGGATLKENARQRAFDRKDLRPGGRAFKAQLRLIRAE